MTAEIRRIIGGKPVSVPVSLAVLLVVMMSVPALSGMQKAAAQTPQPGQDVRPRGMSASFPQISPGEPIPAREAAPATTMESAPHRAAKQPARHAETTGLAATIFRVLASQNVVALYPGESSAFPLSPSGSDSDASEGAFSILHQAKEFYNAATSIRSERAVLYVDPLSLRCRLRIDLGRILNDVDDTPD